jgi:nucleoid DNA-binding protein
MVTVMNKSEFIKKLSERLNYSIEDCTRINSILEDNFIISRKSKDKIIACLINEFNISEEEADKIYNISVEIISTSIKNKILHPFKSS